MALFPETVRILGVEDDGVIIELEPTGSGQKYRFFLRKGLALQASDRIADYFKGPSEARTGDSDDERTTH